MAITYDFIAYSIRTSATTWILGMKAIQGEVPLDIVIPNDQASSDPQDPELVGILTTEGLERESTDGLELYWYLRQLNPKKNETFGYNEVVIRNIHSMLSNLQVDEEIRVQITYSERKEPYMMLSYHIKLIGIFPNSTADAPAAATPESDEPATLFSPENDTQEVQQQRNIAQPEPPVYKTTNTLEKLITFTQNLQQELNQTRRELTVMADKIQQLEDVRQQLRATQELTQDILNQLTQLERFDARIQRLEADRYQLQNLQQNLQKFLTALNQQTRALLQEHDDNNLAK